MNRLNRSSAQPATTSSLSTNDGFALLASLLVLTVVIALVLDQALRARTERLIAMNVVTHTRLRYLAEGGVARMLNRLQMATLEIADREHFDESTPLGSEWISSVAANLDHTLDLDGTHLRLELWDTSARLSLNHAAEEDLRRLFVGLGAPWREANIAAQSILDWRDADQLHRPDGAEWPDYYSSHGTAVMPRNAPFQSVEEARFVRGLDRLFPRAAPHLTVRGSGRVNVNSAPAEVLRTLPGLTEESISYLLARQAAGSSVANLEEISNAVSEPSREQLLESAPSLLSRVAFSPRTFELRSTAWQEGSPIVSVVEAVAVRSGVDVAIVQRIEQ